MAISFDDLVKLSGCKIGHSYSRGYLGPAIDAVKPADVYLCAGCRTKLRKLNRSDVNAALLSMIKPELPQPPERKEGGGK